MVDETSVMAADNLTPAIILVEPQLGENIGAAARAMANFGLTDLRLVAPRDGWPNERAIASASRADHVINAAQVFDTVEQAVADLVFVYATTARNRDIPKVVRGPQFAARHLRQRFEAGQKAGLLFGRERWGLVNEEINLADELVTFPVNPVFASLNIAQAVLLMAYEWMSSGVGEDGLSTRNPIQPFDSRPSEKAHLIGFLDHLEAALDVAGYFKEADLRTSKREKLRALFQRAGLTRHEVDALRGVVSALERRYERQAETPARKT
jgi:tRNA/rRNA methyltransferase